AVAVRDTTPPVITLTTPPPAFTEATSPAGAIVTFAVTATDLVTPSPAIWYSQNPGTWFPVGTTTVTATATDAAGNVGSLTFTVTVRDTTPPVISPMPNLTVEATGPLGAYVNFAATASDAVTLSPAITYSQSPGTLFPFGTTTVIVTATDRAGNASSLSFTVTVQDTTPPVIRIKGVRDGAVYGVNGAPAPSYAASDSGSGLASASAVLSAPTTASGAGVYVYSVTATDKVGNTSTATATYFVLYRFPGFMKPLVEAGSYALGHMIPVKFRLLDANGNLITNAVATLTVDGAAAVSAGGNVGNTFTWDGTQYIFSLSTTGLSAGDHILQATLDDGTVHQVLINLSAAGTVVENGTLLDTSSTVQDGQWITLTGSGFKAGATVTVAIGGTTVNTVTADARGRITDRIQIPMGDPSGQLIITASGLAADGNLRVDSTVITIVPP
ncbi:MAG TPA: HYR domain-containing protein, partial [Candidatus Limnocylindrales bacterium]|nr:HYR domain-containing protein [Candidatus Limnocylindrales bacterium]